MPPGCSLPNSVCNSPSCASRTNSQGRGRFRRADRGGTNRPERLQFAKGFSGLFFRDRSSVSIAPPSDRLALLRLAGMGTYVELDIRAHCRR